MKHHDRPPRGGGITRRTFLSRSAGAFAALAAARAFELDALAQDEARTGNQFLTPEESEAFAAIADRIWPGDDGEPGAGEAGAAVYLDRALAGPYSAYGRTYQVILDELEQAARSRYGTDVASLDGASLDDLLRELEERPEEEDPLATFQARQLELTFGPTSSFELLRRHTMESVFADPIYGGNRDFAGWRAVGYPGAHYVYSAEEQQTFEPLNKPFQSVADL